MRYIVKIVTDMDGGLSVGFICQSMAEAQNYATATHKHTRIYEAETPVMQWTPRECKSGNIAIRMEIKTDREVAC
jgi:hypothetical protein